MMHAGTFCGAVNNEGKCVMSPLEAEWQAHLMPLQHTWTKRYKK